MAFFHALYGVSSLLLVVALGYILALRNHVPDSCRPLIPKFVTNISLPPFLACTIISSIQRDSLLQMLSGAILPFFVMALLFIIAWLGGKMLHVQKKHFGLFCACVSNPNTIFIGIPVNLALFGPEAVPYVLLYYFASTIFFWTVGNFFISRDAAVQSKVKKIHWRNIVSPPILGFLFGVGSVCLNLNLPEFILRAAGLIGDLTTPLALIFIGFTLQAIGLRKLRVTRDMALAIFGRMVLSPLLMWLALQIVPLPQLMGNVFIMQSSLPVLMQVAILSAYYNTDPEFGSEMVAISTLLCAITVPLYMIML